MNILPNYRSIMYKSGYKYQLLETYRIDLEINLDNLIELEYIKITKKGIMTIKNGYAWDGASGLAFDTKNILRASLIHDVLYQLMREGLISKEYKDFADNIFYKICIIDGMSKIRAMYMRYALKIFGGKYILKKNDRKEQIAP